MATWRTEDKYQCFEDCSQGGCPSHTMKLEYNTVVDILVCDIYGNKERTFSLDREQLEKFIALAGQLMHDYTNYKYPNLTEDI